VFRQLGVDASWISRVGDDGFGRYLVGQLIDAGIDTSAVTIDDVRQTGMYVKQRGGGSGRPFDLGRGDSAMTYFRHGSAASALSPADLDGAAHTLLRDADLVHFSGITVALSESTADLTRALLTQSAMISFDLNYRPALWKSDIDSAATILAEHVRGSDVALMGADEASAVFGTADPGELRKMFPEPRHLVVKNDAHTVTGFDGSERTDVPALTLDVVEKIGAGDAFAGGFLTGVLTGKSAVQRIRLGHLCAAGALTGHGDIALVLPVGTLDELAAVSDAQWSTLDYSRLSALSTGVGQ
jgi:2-dehydro-3-deoxygluconokinase